MNRLQVIAIVALGFGGLGTARAREAGDDPDGLIMRGLELRRAGRSDEALRLFQRAYAAAPCPRTLGQMGLVESSLQRWLDAEAHLTAALATPDDLWVHRNHLFLVQAIDRTRQHVGELVITGPPGTRISLGGQAVGPLPLEGPIRLAEGAVAVEARAAGQRPFALDVSIRGGARAAISIVFEPIDLAPANHTPSASAAHLGDAPGSSPHPLRTRVGASLAIGGLATIAWGTAWILLDGGRTCAGCASAYDTRTSGLLLVGGGAVMALGGSLLLWPALRRDRATWTVGLGGRSFDFQARF
jgi:hypothetical protein